MYNKYHLIAVMHHSIFLLFLLISCEGKLMCSYQQVMQYIYLSHSHTHSYAYYTFTYLYTSINDNTPPSDRLLSCNVGINNLNTGYMSPYIILLRNVYGIPRKGWKTFLSTSKRITGTKMQSISYYNQRGCFLICSIMLHIISWLIK